MNIREEVEMRIERIPVFPLPRNDDDNPMLSNPSQFSESGSEVEDVLQNVCVSFFYGETGSAAVKLSPSETSGAVTLRMGANSP